MLRSYWVIGAVDGIGRLWHANSNDAVLFAWIVWFIVVLGNPGASSQLILFILIADANMLVMFMYAVVLL
jgi:hypothetical protein